ncbi:PhzF family phenazine biosynthesis isomerase [Nonomuraea sp. NPDC049152]|uniref:PhzF family phenazine biosynthesis protein n=1 Tax=Nonomuraea sp. NPDC049152 TaxID=3154350 RepID=UPI0033CABA8C
MRLFIVDAFTDTAFQGNPAAVCLLESGASDRWMQSVAAEMRLSETAFLLGNSLRWFTPAVEVSLCGHATLATAHVLYSTGAATGEIQFATKGGILPINRSDDGLISMDFPAKEVTPATVPDGLEKALGAAVVGVGRSQLDLVVELESEEAVRSLDPDITALEKVDARGIIVTALAASPRATTPPVPGTGAHPTPPETTAPHAPDTTAPSASGTTARPMPGTTAPRTPNITFSTTPGSTTPLATGTTAASAPRSTASPVADPASAAPHAGSTSAIAYDYVSRFFAPRVGVPEDPVTGSAHCALAPFWSARLGRASLVGAQLSARGGLIRTTARGDRVDLAGRAVTILSGTFHINP